jgi:predicted DNA-binding protein
MRKQTSIRLAEETKRQIAALMKLWQTRQSEVIARCIDRVYQQETRAIEQAKEQAK